MTPASAVLTLPDSPEPKEDSKDPIKSIPVTEIEKYMWKQKFIKAATLKDIPDDGVQDEIRAKLLEVILANVESDPDTAAALASELEYLPLNDIIQLSN
ncbi:hypothetical protein ACHAXA_009713 [Cyclostephanos tholiformis]|uniref:Uncharacterized protein n=1 Tax=Cyclostephanos tholiformis TaxID=382380 RepID=A0ABD3RV55_9STRA